MRARSHRLAHNGHRVKIAVHALRKARLIVVVKLGAGLDDAFVVALVRDFLRAQAARIGGQIERVA